MWGMNHDRQFEFLGEFDLDPERFVFKRGLLVVAEFAHGNDAFLDQEARQCIENRLGQNFIIGFLRIETDRAVVTNAELTGAEALEPGDQGKIIDKAAYIGARLPEPECGFDDRYD